MSGYFLPQIYLGETFGSWNLIFGLRDKFKRVALLVFCAKNNRVLLHFKDQQICCGKSFHVLEIILQVVCNVILG